MSEKRRRARVQGGWATNDNSSQGTSDLKFNPRNKGVSQFRESSSKGEPRTVDASCKNTQPSVSAQPKSASGFVFKDDISKESRQIPDDIYIRKNGQHELSKGPSGCSSIVLKDDFLTADEQEWMMDQLLNEIPWKQEKIVIKAEKIDQPRLTAWFGSESYTYSGLKLNPYQLSPSLILIREKIESFTGHTFNSVLANLYRDCKDSIDWHSDDEDSLGKFPVIASLSLGDTRIFEMRKKPESGLEDDFKYTQRVKIPLRGGSLLVMEGATQLDWQVVMDSSGRLDDVVTRSFSIHGDFVVHNHTPCTEFPRNTMIEILASI